MKVFLEELESSTSKDYNIKKNNLENIKYFSSNNEYFKVIYYLENCTVFEHKSVKIRICSNIFQYKADVILNTIAYTKIYGWVKDNHNNPIDNTDILIYKKGYSNCSDKYLPILSTITDDYGMFQVVLQKHNNLSDIKVEVDN